MSLRNKLVAFALLTLSAFNANAGIEKDDKNVSIFAALISSDFSDTLFLSASGGYFYTEVLELQGIVSMIDSGGFSSITFGGNANKYLPNSGNPDFIPYVGGGLQLTVNDIDTSLGINGQVGIKQFLTEDMAINYQAQLVLADDTQFILSAGFTFFLE